ncbi:hypothetical protein BDR03DRAFT_597457 [Suillus americanus]|nr:hypothetical protein BDR03DRAFT_597457 [Suillus americanus]
MVSCAGIYHKKQHRMDELNVITFQRTKDIFCKRRGPGRLMITVGILRGGKTCRDPKTSPAPSVSDYDIRVGGWSCIRDSGRCDG